MVPTNEERLTAVEISISYIKEAIESQWKNHDKNSEEHWGNMKTMLNSISGRMSELSGKFDNLPCHITANNEKNINWLWKMQLAIFASIVGVIAAIARLAIH